MFITNFRCLSEMGLQVILVLGMKVILEWVFQNNMEVGFIILGTVVLMLTVNVLIYKLIVDRAVKKYINPYLSILGYKIDKVKFAGLFQIGDFKRKGSPLRPFMFGGYPIHSTYIYVFVKTNDPNNNPVRITARIISLFLFIRKVEYSNNLNLEL